MGISQYHKKQKCKYFPTTTMEGRHLDQFGGFGPSAEPEFWSQLRPFKPELWSQLRPTFPTVGVAGLLAGSCWLFFFSAPQRSPKRPKAGLTQSGPKSKHLREWLRSPYFLLTFRKAYTPANQDGPPQKKRKHMFTGISLWGTRHPSRASPPDHLRVAHGSLAQQHEGILAWPSTMAK